MASLLLLSCMKTRHVKEEDQCRKATNIRLHLGLLRAVHYSHPGIVARLLVVLHFLHLCDKPADELLGLVYCPLQGEVHG